MSKANYLKRSLIEAGIGATIGSTAQVASAIKGKESRDNIALSGLKGALLGGAMTGGLGQVTRIARSAGKFKNQLGTHTRYKSLAEEAKNLESRLPLVRQQLDNWDQAWRMENALSDLKKMEKSPFLLPSAITDLQEHKSLANLNFAKLDKVHGSLSESLKKFDTGGVGKKNLEDISKNIQTLKSRRSIASGDTQKSRQKLTQGIVEDWGMDFEDAKDHAELRLRGYMASRKKGVMSSDTYPVATHLEDDFPTIRLEIADEFIDAQAFPSLVTAQKAKYFTHPTRDRPATHKIVKDKFGKMTLANPKDNRPGSLTVLKTIPEGTPFKKLRSMGYASSNIPGMFNKSLTHHPTNPSNILTIKDRSPVGYRYSGTVDPLDQLNTGVKSVDNFEAFGRQNTDIEGKLKDLESNKQRMHKIKSSIQAKQRAISNVRRSASDIVRDTQQDLKSLTQRPRQIETEQETIRMNLRQQMENDVYGKWFGVF